MNSLGRFRHCVKSSKERLLESWKRNLTRWRQFNSKVLSNSDLSGYLARSQNLLDRTPALRTIYGEKVDEHFLDYVDCKAILVQPEIQECGIAFPNWRQMVTVGGEVNLEMFLDVGKQTFDWIRSFLPLDEKKKILDFGVGCARTARHLFRFSEKISLYGCDVDQKAIEYCTQALPFMKSIACDNTPPLQFAENYFDAVYSISVFSHLNLSAFDSWIIELHRVLKKEAVLVFTFHGPSAYQKIEEQKLYESLVIYDWTNNYSANRKFTEEFLWLPQIVGSKDIDSNAYGISFTSAEFIEARYSKLFTKILFQHSVGNWQDLIVLKKR